MNADDVLCPTCKKLVCACDPTAITITEDSVEGVDPEFHAIIKEYGRSMFATMINASQANATAEVLTMILNRLQNNDGRNALLALLQAFNQLTNAYVAEMDWSEERMMECQKEINAVMQTMVVTPPSTLVGSNGQPLH